MVRSGVKTVVSLLSEENSDDKPLIEKEKVFTQKNNIKFVNFSMDENPMPEQVNQVVKYLKTQN